MKALLSFGRFYQTLWRNFQSQWAEHPVQLSSKHANLQSIDDRAQMGSGFPQKRID
jgi:hypothetical protein